MAMVRCNECGYGYSTEATNNPTPIVSLAIHWSDRSELLEKIDDAKWAGIINQHKGSHSSCPKCLAPGSVAHSSYYKKAAHERTKAEALKRDKENAVQRDRVTRLKRKRINSWDTFKPLAQKLRQAIIEKGVKGLYICRCGREAKVTVKIIESDQCERDCWGAEQYSCAVMLKLECSEYHRTEFGDPSNHPEWVTPDVNDPYLNLSMCDMSVFFDYSYKNWVKTRLSISRYTPNPFDCRGYRPSKSRNMFRPYGYPEIGGQGGYEAHFIYCENRETAEALQKNSEAD